GHLVAMREELSGVCRCRANGRHRIAGEQSSKPCNSERGRHVSCPSEMTSDTTANHGLSLIMCSDKSCKCRKAFTCNDIVGPLTARFLRVGAWENASQSQQSALREMSGLIWRLPRR